MRQKTFLIAFLFVLLSMTLSTSAQDGSDNNQIRFFPQDGDCVIGWANPDNDTLLLDGEGITVVTDNSTFHLCQGEIPFGEEGVRAYNFTLNRYRTENLATIEQLCELRPEACQDEDALLFFPNIFQPGEVDPCHLRTVPQTYSDDWLEVVDFDGNATFMCHQPASDD